MLFLLLLSILIFIGLFILFISLLIRSSAFRRIISIGGVFACISLILVMLFYPALPQRSFRYLKQQFVDNTNNKRTITKIKKEHRCHCNAANSGLPKDRYSKHRLAAKKLSSGQLISSNKHREQLRTEGTLKTVPAMMGLHIRPLTHSSKDLHKNVMPSLTELVDRFNKTCTARKIKDGEIIISSVTRTVDEQIGIRKHYPKSATRGVSAHSYGAAIDIVSVISSNECLKARKALYDVLKNMRSEGKLLLCPENGCIHVTFKDC